MNADILKLRYVEHKRMPAIAKELHLSRFALGFQAFLIMVCVGIYAVLVQNISVDSDVSTALWTCIGYTVLLCFTLFKSSSVAKSIFNAH